MPLARSSPHISIVSRRRRSTYWQTSIRGLPSATCFASLASDRRRKVPSVDIARWRPTSDGHASEAQNSSPDLKSFLAQSYCAAHRDSDRIGQRTYTNIPTTKMVTQALVFVCFVAVTYANIWTSPFDTRAHWAQVRRSLSGVSKEETFVE